MAKVVSEDDLLSAGKYSEREFKKMKIKCPVCGKVDWASEFIGGCAGGSRYFLKCHYCKYVFSVTVEVG